MEITRMKKDIKTYNFGIRSECAKGLLYHKNTCVWKNARKRHHTAVYNE